MTTYSRSLLLGRLAGGLIVGVLTGFLIGQVLLGICVVLTLYLIWSLSQLLRLLKWLEKASSEELEPPESHGLWGAIFDGIYRVQKRQNSSKKQLKSVIDRIQESTAALEDGIVMVDKSGNLEWWNRAAEDLLGLKMPDDQGQLMTNLVRDPLFYEYFDSGNHTDSIELLCPVNDNKQLQIGITVYGEGNRLLLIRDITRLKQLETMRKDFVANVSHELRTPLTVISGYLETLLDTAELNKSLPPVWLKALNRMQEQSVRMQTLVADLLLLSRLESADPNNSEKIELKTLLEEIIADAHALSGDNQHKITLNCAAHTSIKGNQSELRSAISNLVFNAVRYTPIKGTIQVNFEVNNDEGCIKVEDNGMGIDPVHIPRLTERFYRVDKGRSLASGGTGLGLAIVKHVLLRHSGYLSIISHPGNGSCFTCHLPRNRFEIENEELA